jgi:glycerol-3-phosphate dehydrogenase
VVERAAQDPSLLERLHADGPDIAAQALFAATDEWADTADDVLRRRTTVALRGLADADAVHRVERLLATARPG